VYSIENEFSAGETTIGTGSRYVQKSEAKEAYTDDDGKEHGAVEASWTFFVDGKVEKTMPIGKEDILDEITKHITDTSGKHRSFEKYKSIENGHMYVGNGEWLPQGDGKEFPIPPDTTSTSGVPPVKEAEDGKYYKGNNGKTYYFTKKDGYKEI